MARVYRDDIDGLRALAVGLVLIFHFFPTTLPSGFVGVDIFFVISGYLLTGIITAELGRRQFSLASFYQRRVLRIFPALLVVTAATTFAAWYLLFENEFGTYGKHLFSGLLFFANFTFWGESGYFAADAHTKPLLHLWSLCVEEQFYLIWPVVLALMASARRLNSRSLWILTASFWLICFAIRDPSARFFWPLTRFWEFTLGGSLALMSSQRTTEDEDVLNLIAFGGAILLAFGIYLCGLEIGPAHIRVLPVLVGVALLLWSGPLSLLAQYGLGNPLLRAVGWISYPLYLWHWPLVVFGHLLGWTSWQARTLLLLTSIVLATLTYLAIERPIRKQPMSTRRALTLVSTALLITLASIGSSIYLTQGRFARIAIQGQKQKGLATMPGEMKGSCEKLTGVHFSEDWCDAQFAGDRAPSAVMLGDSFALGMGNILRYFARQNPELDLVYRAYGRGGCPTLIDFGPPWCREMAAKVMDYIERESSVRVVIFTINWRRYIRGAQFVQTDQIESDLAFARALRQTIKRLNARGVHVAAFLSPPIVRSPLTCVDRLNRFGVDANCRSQWSLAADDNRATRDLLLPFFKANGVDIIDPVPWLCNEHDCAVAYDGYAIYGHDGMHLEIAAGPYLAKKGRADLMSVLSQ